MTVSIAVKPQATNSDLKALFGEVISTTEYNHFGGEQIEEGKDTNRDQSNMRSWQMDLGYRSAGDLEVGLYTAMEKTSNYAEIKYLSIFIWKV